ncbi:MAG: hypothetical protein ACPGO3_04845 [Magnetospiraceae bacterium]
MSQETEENGSSGRFNNWTLAAVLGIVALISFASIIYKIHFYGP